MNNRTLWTAVLLGLMACKPTGTTSPTGTSTPSSTAADDSCQQCLDGGGTWQPEASECTSNCDIMDISCFTDSCPDACAADNCGGCFDAETCEAATCTWNQQDEAAWCN